MDLTQEAIDWYRNLGVRVEYVTTFENPPTSYTPNVNDVYLIIKDDRLTGDPLSVPIEVTVINKQALGQRADLYFQAKSSTGTILSNVKQVIPSLKNETRYFFLPKAGGTQKITLEAYLWLADTLTAISPKATGSFTPPQYVSPPGAPPLPVKPQQGIIEKYIYPVLALSTAGALLLPEKINKHKSYKRNKKR